MHLGQPVQAHGVTRSVATNGVASTSVPAEVLEQIASSTALVEAADCSGQRTGTGVLTSDGNVLTNAHVLAGATSARVTFAGVLAAAEDDVTAGAVEASVSAGDDLALLRLGGDGDRGPLASPPAGLSGPHPDQPILIAGYPHGGPLDIAQGAITDSARGSDYGSPGGTVWRTNIEVEPGHSGSGVFADDGALIGLVFARADNDHTAVVIPAGRLGTSSVFPSRDWAECPTTHRAARRS
jgi:S1-C subfamily serine protease